MARASVAKKSRVITPKSSRSKRGSIEGRYNAPILNRSKRVSSKSFIHKIRSNSSLMYLGGSVATVFLIRWGYRFYKSHPEIKEFLLDNFDTVEDKLREYRNSFGADISESRH